MWLVRGEASWRHGLCRVGATAFAWQEATLGPRRRSELRGDAARDEQLDAVAVAAGVAAQKWGVLATLNVARSCEASGRALQEKCRVARERCEVKRAAYREQVAQVPVEKLVFLDECGFWLCLFRLYGWTESAPVEWPRR